MNRSEYRQLLSDATFALSGIDNEHTEVLDRALVALMDRDLTVDEQLHVHRHLRALDGQLRETISWLDEQGAEEEVTAVEKAEYRERQHLAQLTLDRISRLADLEPEPTAAA